MRIGARRAVLVLLGLVLAGPTLDAGTWYVSNRLGMKLEVIARYRTDEFPYVLEESIDGGVTTLRLYHRGETAAIAPAAGASPHSPLEGPPAGAAEVTRWERSAAEGGLTRESVWERGVLDRVTLYRADGRVSTETVYAAGVPAEDHAYRYAGGFLRTIESRPAGGGDLLWSVVYDLSPDGELRAARRTGREAETAAFALADGKLQEEYLATENRTVVLRYDGSGRRVVWEVYGGEKLVRATYDVFDPATGSVTRSRDLVGSDERIERSYDAQGHVVEEAAWRGESLVSTTRHTWGADGLRRTTERRSDEGIELWSYTYGQDGSLATEEYRERGTLRLRTVYTGAEERYEEIIQSTRSALRVYFVKDQRVREDFVRDGKVVRTRDLREGAP